MEITSIILSGYLAFVLTYLAGLPISLFFLSNNEYPVTVNFFIKLALGYILIPTVYSIFYTSGYTIFSGVAILLFLTLFLNKNNLDIKLDKVILNEWKLFTLAGLVLTLFISLQFYRNHYFDPNITFASMQDNGIYSTVAEYLKVTGIETSSPWYQLFDVSADGIAKVYHYEDFWYLAFVLDIYKGMPLDVYNYVFTAVLPTINFFGYFALGVALSGNKWSAKYFIPISMGLVVFSMGIKDIQWTNYFDVNAFKYPKIASLPILLSLALISRRYGLKYMDSLAFGVLILVDTLFMPTILGVGGCYYLFKLYQTRNKENILQIGMLFFSILFFFTFYTLFASLDNSSVTSLYKGDKGYLYYFIKELVAALVKHFIFLFPVYLAVVYMWMNKQKLTIFQKEYFALLFGVLFFSAIGTALMTYNVEGFQFAVLVHTSASALMVLGSIIILWGLPSPEKKFNIFRKVVISLLALQIVYGVFATIELQQNRDSGVQTQFLEMAKNRLTGLNRLGVGISNPDNSNSFTIDPRICRYCNFLKQIGHGYWVNQLVLPISLDELPFKERSKAVELSPFFRFMNILKENKKMTTLEDAQVAFINNYNVDFAVIEKGAMVPIQIQRCVEKRFIDTYSGTTVLILKRPCSNVN